MSTLQVLQAKLLGLISYFLKFNKTLVLQAGFSGDVKIFADKTSKGGSMVGVMKTKNGRKVFFKLVQTRFKTIPYYHLINEATFLQIFKKVEFIAENSLIVRFPLIHRRIHNKNVYALSTEFIEGKTLDNFSSEFMVKAIKGVLYAFEDLTHKANKFKEDKFIKRKAVITFLQFPWYLMLVLLKDSKNGKLLLKMAYAYYKYYFSSLFMEVEYVLTHRDLYPRNIIINKKQVIVIDPEMVAKCEKGTDLAIILPYYLHKIGIEKTISIINDFFPDSNQKARFVSLSIFHAIQIMATESVSDADYKMTLRFCRQFMNSALNKLYIPSLAPAEYFIMAGLRFISYWNKFFSFWATQKDTAILSYHSIANDGWRFSTSINDFQNQMLELKKTKQVVSLSTFIQGDRSPRQVVITFDDGYVDNLTIAAPMLKKLKLPATLFVLGNTKNPNRHELDNNKPLMNILQIKKLKKMGWEIGFHTSTHADLSKATDAELYREIVLGKIELEKRLGFALKYFAYPRGAYSKRIGEFVDKAGFQAAFTVDGGRAISSTENRFISRIGMEASIKGELFSTSLSELGMHFQTFYMSILRFKAYTLPTLVSPIIRYGQVYLRNNKA